MTKMIRSGVLAGLAVTACAVADAGAAPAVFGGGSYDGYARNVMMQRTLGVPVINNAGGATNVLPTSAWLNGTLVDTGTASTAVSVYWGPADGVTTKAAWTNRCDFGPCVAGQSLTTNLAGLAQDTTYYYRFYATNTAGDDAWADASAWFATLGSPTVTTGSGATSIGPRTTSLNGNLTAGGNATIILYWGQNSNNWSAVSNVGVVAQGAFSTAVSGLSAGALYYYSWRATNAYGDTSSGVGLLVTTLAPALFGGGSYDGYDRKAVQTQMQLVKGGTAMFFR